MIIIHIKHTSVTFVLNSGRLSTQGAAEVSGHAETAQRYRCAEIRRDGELELEDQDDRSGDNQAATEDGLPGQGLPEKERGKHKNHHQAGFIDRRNQ